MSRGLARLAGIAGTASLLGIFETLREIWVALPAVGHGYSCCGECACGFSEVFFATVMGLLVVTFASWTRAYLCGKLEIFDTEMRVATLELANALSVLTVRG